MKPRKVKADGEIQGDFKIQIYDERQRRLRDKDWIETGDIVRSGISSGLALALLPLAIVVLNALNCHGWWAFVCRCH